LIIPKQIPPNTLKEADSLITAKNTWAPDFERAGIIAYIKAL
jgi:hypothetical protein